METAVCARGALPAPHPMRRTLWRLNNAAWLAAEGWRRRAAPRGGGRVACNVRPMAQALGGGNQWVSQFTAFLRARDWDVTFRLEPGLDAIVLAAPRPSPTVTFSWQDIEAYRRRYPETAVLQRINEHDLRKATGYMDALLARTNAVADVTCFVSAWLRDYHASRWFDRSRPHAVILNGADTRVFHADGGQPWQPGNPFRLVTHHWSDHPSKGFAAYEALDRLIADGALPGVEFMVIGRWPRTTRWRAAAAVGPVSGERLAGLLRQAHAYLTASQWEPGPMHTAEGAQCGLPVLYHADGGGTVEACEPFGISFQDDLRAAVLDMRARYPELRRAVLERAPSGTRMCEAYLAVMDDAIASVRKEQEACR